MVGFVKYFLAFVLISMAIVVVSWLGLWKIAGARIFSVQSGSMSPTFSRGDLVIDTKPEPQKLRAGEVISFYSSHNSGQLVTHRIIANFPSRSYLVTKGDNLSELDPIVPYQSVVGKTLKAIPKAGYAFNKVHNPKGLIAFVYGPAAIICLSELWIITAQYKYRPYQLI